MAQKCVTINVGGQKYTTTLSTLRRVPDSMLGRMFSDDWEDNKLPNSSSDHEVFIDNDGTQFRHILNFLRRGEQMFLPDNREVLREIAVEAHYYQLHALVDLCESKLAEKENVITRAIVWSPAVGDRVKWRTAAIEGYCRNSIINNCCLL